MTNIEYLLSLHSINGLGPIRLSALLKHFQDPKIIWELDANLLLKSGLPKSVVENFTQFKKSITPLQYLEYIQSCGIKFVTIYDQNYPTLLSQIPNPPIVLFFRGQFPDNMDQSVGVVGTRRITSYGKIVTEKFSQALASSGIIIVSGLARGVDSVAHQSTIDAKGQTIAVLGGGLNKIFPSENLKLAQNIIDLGLGAVVSEFPPDFPSLPQNFPARNRIISGLSRGVLVTEADAGSGSLITAKEALDQGREVYAIPGPITSQYSKGPSLLIKQGAKLVTEPEEILEDLGIHRSVIRDRRSDYSELSETEKKVLDLLIGEQRQVDEICRVLNSQASQVSACLIKMEIKGLIKNIGGGNYIKTI